MAKRKAAKRELIDTRKDKQFVEARGGVQGIRRCWTFAEEGPSAERETEGEERPR